MAVRNKKKGNQTKKPASKNLEQQPQKIEEDDSEEQSEEETIPAKNDESGDEEIENPATSQESEPAEDSEEEEAMKTTIFVGHIKYDLVKQDLEEFFGRAGEVKAVRIIPKKGFAFVTFANEKSLEKALKFNNEKLKGREVHIERVKTKQSDKKKQKKRKLDAEIEERKAKKAKLEQTVKKRRFYSKAQKKGPGKNGSKPRKSVRAN
ncbi:RNA-binding protein 34-like [Toxorhynchites rutilus septentrionalis]|uniref:RNA-binding protein 34-like n=1 Tax=Toxorhynchites rutilus septentrionalis TaxID=329112 RepID=UPI002479AF4E|nr:RNA-binding protein 34-like [Toxorhynchites rutilus septentrionalis]XP_055638177.1 RNA-binding protein 34-like [Toxorhynchites rutilus septentrionalis]XP_055638178.1 RNA-binding protein 34-like [Toxorhynchites rutilus septentrionalis]